MGKFFFFLADVWLMMWLYRGASIDFFFFIQGKWLSYFSEFQFFKFIDLSTGQEFLKASMSGDKVVLTYKRKRSSSITGLSHGNSGHNTVTEAPNDSPLDTPDKCETLTDEHISQDPKGNSTVRFWKLCKSYFIFYCIESNKKCHLGLSTSNIAHISIVDVLHWLLA